jgi:hypothetical protein
MIHSFTVQFKRNFVGNSVQNCSQSHPRRRRAPSDDRGKWGELPFACRSHPGAIAPKPPRGLSTLCRGLGPGRNRRYAVFSMRIYFTLFLQTGSRLRLGRVFDDYSGRDISLFQTFEYAVDIR